MEYLTVSDSITKKVLNETTGELEQKEFREVSKKSRLRGGFNLMYHIKYAEVMESVIKSNSELRLFNWITNRFTYARREAQIVHSICEVDIGKRQFSEMIKKLVELKYLIRIGRGIYRLNPFVYVPYKADATELQDEWLSLSGSD